MNKNYIVTNLEEAHLELEQVLKDLKQDGTFGEQEFNAAMSSVYHYLNTAWNARHATESEVNELSSEHFYLWREFPSLDEFFLEEFETRNFIQR